MQALPHPFFSLKVGKIVGLIVGFFVGALVGEGMGFAPDGRPIERVIGLGAAQALGSVLLDDGASFVEEAVCRGQGQREDGGRELAHVACACAVECINTRRAAREVVSHRAVAAARDQEARAGALSAGGPPAGVW